MSLAQILSLSQQPSSCAEAPRRSAPTLPDWFRSKLARDPRTRAAGLDPDDVIQEMQLVMWQRGWPGARGVRLHWLLLEVLRKLRRPPMDELSELAPDVRFPLEALLDVAAAAQRLPPSERVALARSTAGEPLRAIADDLGVSITTAHRLVAGARAKVAAA